MYQQYIDYITGEIATKAIIRLSDNACIPQNNENSDWQQYELWLAQGNKPLAPGQPTPEQLIAECKETATNILSATDWTAIPDVADPLKSNPYLMNQDEFVAYRSTIRNYAVNPVADPIWPTPPVEQWSN
jgi:hypothetical protein